MISEMGMLKGSNHPKKTVEIDVHELAVLRSAKDLLMRRVKAEQIKDPVQRLQKLSVIRVDTLHWLKRH